MQKENLVLSMEYELSDDLVKIELERMIESIEDLIEHLETQMEPKESN